MSIRQVRVNNPLLKEGQVYPFRIIRQVELGSAEHYWVLQDPSGYKVLMPSQYYLLYGFQQGQTIHCRVDKINCNGKMFLEPMHPVYREGSVYEFVVVESGQRTNLLGKNEYFCLVKDALGVIREVRTPFVRDLPGSIRCRIMKIKKGRLYLDLENGADQPELLPPDQWIPFKIISVKTNPTDKQAWYILQAADQQKYLLKKKYYQHYGFKIGQTISCRAEKYSGQGQLVLEPKHPCHELDKVYDFTVLGLEELVFSDDSRQKVLILEDCLGHEVKVHIPDQWLPLLQDREKVKARVLNIRKSRPELEIIRGLPT